MWEVDDCLRVCMWEGGDCLIVCDVVIWPREHYHMIWGAWSGEQDHMVWENYHVAWGVCHMIQEHDHMILGSIIT